MAVAEAEMLRNRCNRDRRVGNMAADRAEPPGSDVEHVNGRVATVPNGSPILFPATGNDCAD
jgi:hypothetical protein